MIDWNEGFAFKLNLAWHLVKNCLFWPLVQAIGDEQCIAANRVGITISWRNLWTTDGKGTISLDEASVLYACALDQGNREMAQELAEKVQAGKFKEQHEN